MAIRFIGKGEVGSSILPGSTIVSQENPTLEITGSSFREDPARCDQDHDMTWRGAARDIALGPGCARACRRCGRPDRGTVLEPQAARDRPGPDNGEEAWIP